MSAMSYQIARVWGIPIRLNLSLIILFFYLASRFGPITGTLLGVGFLVSIVLHELGHSYAAIRKGCRVRQITLMVVGGAAQMERIPERPWDEFVMAIAGPLVSLALGCILIPIGHATSILPPLPGFGVNILLLLGSANIVLAVFNMIPAFPMDGGRILRAALTPRFGRLKATACAARLGQLVSIGFIVAAWNQSPRNPLLVLVAVFVFFAAGQEYKQVRMQEAARHGRRPGWPFFRPSPFGPPPFEPPPEGRAVISPPPYASGPPREADVHTDAKPPAPFR